jgi:hypothetical protein
LPGIPLQAPRIKIAARLTGTPLTIFKNFYLIQQEKKLKPTVPGIIFLSAKLVKPKKLTKQQRRNKIKSNIDYLVFASAFAWAFCCLW